MLHFSIEASVVRKHVYTRPVTKERRENHSVFVCSGLMLGLARCAKATRHGVPSPEITCGFPDKIGVAELTRTLHDRHEVRVRSCPQCRLCHGWPQRNLQRIVPGSQQMLDGEAVLPASRVQSLHPAELSVARCRTW